MKPSEITFTAEQRLILKRCGMAPTAIDDLQKCIAVENFYSSQTEPEATVRRRRTQLVSLVGTINKLIELCRELDDGTRLRNRELDVQLGMMEPHLELLQSKAQAALKKARGRAGRPPLDFTSLIYQIVVTLLIHNIEPKKNSKQFCTIVETVLYALGENGAKAEDRIEKAWKGKVLATDFQGKVQSFQESIPALILRWKKGEFPDNHICDD